MLNPFPIQFLALFAYFLLRVGVGAILLYFAYAHFRVRKKLGRVFSTRLLPYGLKFAWLFICVEAVVGAMFVAGYYTQIAALLTMAMSLKLIVLHKRFAPNGTNIESRLFYILLFIVAATLFITGAGAFAFDLPI
jgi:uncharacterized membrane protein YphA (DoxX/SURF4 family)